MTRRIISNRLPGAPLAWDPSSREAWNQLITALEASEIFDKGRRTLPEFLVVGSVSAATTLDVDGASLNSLRHIVGRLVLALNDSRYITAIESSIASSAEPAPPAGAEAFVSLSDTPDSYAGQAGKVVAVNASADGLEFLTVGGTGTVTSIGLTAPAQLSVAGSPVSIAGNIGLSWTDQTNNTFFAGPTAAPAGTPTFRALTSADLPSTSVTPGTYGTSALVPRLTVDARGRLTEVIHTTISPSDIGAALAGPVSASGLTMDSGFLLGRTSTGAGNPAQVSIGGRLTLTNNQLNAINPLRVTKVMRTSNLGLPINIVNSSVGWDAVIIDEVGAYATATPTRLVIPTSAVGLIRLTAYFNYTNTGADVRAWLTKDGTNTTSAVAADIREGVNESSHHLDSGWLVIGTEVTAGSTFEAVLLPSVASTAVVGPVGAVGGRSWFQMEHRPY